MNTCSSCKFWEFGDWGDIPAGYGNCAALSSPTGETGSVICFASDGCGASDFYTEGGFGCVLHSPKEDIWELLDKMAKDGWRLNLFDNRDFNNPPHWSASFSNANVEFASDLTEADGETANIAIRASLELVLNLS